MSANAILEADLALVGATGITASIFAPESDVLVASVATWVEATNRKGVFTATQALGLSGKYFIEFFNSGGARCGSGYVFMTDTASVHLVVGYASVTDKDGSSGTSPLGPGAYPMTFTFEHGGIPDVNATVWITSDAAGATVVAGALYTNDNGNVTFLLTPGTTYYLWFLLAGQQPIQGQPFTAVTP